MALPETPPRGRVTGRIGDPLQGVRQPEPIILPHPSALFAHRAERLLVLAEGHLMADWLRFLERIARAQHEAVGAMMVTAPSIESAVAACLPPLAPGTHNRNAVWHDALAALLRGADDPSLPDQATAVIATLRRTDAGALEVLAGSYLAGNLSAQAGESLFIGASLQVYFARLAATLQAPALRLLPQRGLCPVCGFAPVAGVITAAGNAPGARYLHCGLCATAWNHVRAVCINCGESRSLALHEIEGGSGAVKAETCDACHGYAKMMYQAADMQVDPMADDLASFGLDILVGEAGWSRHAPNPLVMPA
jgi:FdhE protein